MFKYCICRQNSTLFQQNFCNVLDLDMAWDHVDRTRSKEWISAMLVNPRMLFLRFRVSSLCNFILFLIYLWTEFCLWSFWRLVDPDLSAVKVEIFRVIFLFCKWTICIITNINCLHLLFNNATEDFILSLNCNLDETNIKDFIVD